jgi:hypothetical protein
LGVLGKRKAHVRDANDDSRRLGTEIRGANALHKLLSIFVKFHRDREIPFALGFLCGRQFLLEHDGVSLTLHSLFNSRVCWAVGLREQTCRAGDEEGKAD